MLQAGEFDRVVTIEQRVIARDFATGAQAIAWVPFLSGVWCKALESAKGMNGLGEKMAGDAFVYGRPLTLAMWWQPGIDTTMRVNESGVLYQILGTAMLGRREGLELLCAAWTLEYANPIPLVVGNEA